MALGPVRLLLAIGIPGLVTGTPGSAESAVCVGCSNEDCGSNGSGCSCWPAAGADCTRRGVTFHNTSCQAFAIEG